MQVKVFETTDMATGLKLVKKELGPDALILSTRTVRSGRLGLLGKQMLEITAAVDTPWPTKTLKPAASPPTPPPFEHQIYAQNSAPTFSPAPEINPDAEIGAVHFKIGSRPARPSALSDNPPVPLEGNPQLSQEFDELKNMVKTLAADIARLNQPAATSLTRDRQPTAGISPLQQKLQTPAQARVQELLLSYGVSEETAATISEFAKDSLNADDLSDDGKLCEFLRSTICNIIEVAPPLFEDAHGPHRIALVGPTGVGKTTTLAKIAALYLSGYSNSIALITIDTYRIAAVEQLKVYGEIMHIPVDVVLTPAQLQEALSRHRDKELILIDTAGRSPRDSLSIDELSGFFDNDCAIAKHLVLSATNREEEINETIARFSRLGIDATIFTKVDECINLGIILNTQIHNRAPISYITNGQRVPEDLLAADKRKIAELILPHP